MLLTSRLNSQNKAENSMSSRQHGQNKAVKDRQQERLGKTTKEY